MLPSATRLSRMASPYRPPMPLEDLPIRDDLELALRLFTVSCHGHNPCLQPLRLAFREHG